MVNIFHFSKTRKSFVQSNSGNTIHLNWILKFFLEVYLHLGIFKIKNKSGVSQQGFFFFFYLYLDFTTIFWNVFDRNYIFRNKIPSYWLIDVSNPTIHSQCFKIFESLILNSEDKIFHNLNIWKIITHIFFIYEHISFS